MATQGIDQSHAQRPRGKTSGGRMPGDAGPLTAYLFMAPYLVLFTIFVVVPVVFGVWVSLHNWDPLLPVKPFVGLQNYVDLATPGSTTFEPFWKSMEATGKFTLYSVPLLVIVPLLIALILNREFRGRNFFRATFFAPYVLGVAVIGILWRFLLDPNIGLVNYYLGVLGLPDNIPWITALPWAWVSLVGVTVWWTLGFNTVIYLAGLQDIDTALYDAAKVDGANSWQRFRERDPARTQARPALRDNGDDPGLGQHVRPGLLDHARRPRQRYQTGHLVHRRAGLEVLQDGPGGGDELRAGPRPGRGQPRQFRAFPLQGRLR